MFKKLLSIILFSATFITQIDSSEIEKYYIDGVNKVKYSIKNQNKINNQVLLYKEAYSDFKKSAELGYLKSLYYMGFLHELAAYNGFSFDKDMNKLEHLSYASQYYGSVLKEFPQAYDALSRVTVEAIEELKENEKSKKNDSWGFFDYIQNIVG